MGDQWFIVRDDKKYGPYSLAQMKQFAASGKLLPIDMVSQGGTDPWVTASQVEAFFPQSELPPLPPAPPVAVEPAEWHYTQGGRQAGPVAWSQLRQLAASGGLSASDMVWK